MHDFGTIWWIPCREASFADFWAEFEGSQMNFLKMPVLLLVISKERLLLGLQLAAMRLSKHAPIRE